MDISVGAEYVIANALIVLSQKGIDRVTFSTLRDLGWSIQQRCNKAGVEAIILTSGMDIKAAVYDFSDYFEYENISEPTILIKKCVPIKDLQERFILCLPKAVKEVIQETTVAYWEAA